MKSRGMFGLSVVVFAIGASAAEISGVVTGPKGPEAGVWVIAETTDLPTKFAKVVVTDERGRYLIPELPEATYSVWLRGYGLVDSEKVKSAAGKTLNLKAVAAPSAKAAAEYYPGMYWYALLTQAGKAMTNMATGLGYMGVEGALKRYADWTDRIAGGEVPFAQPERPKGVERNVVITMWDWATNKAYLHDSIATDKNNPTVNANGKIYGAPEESTDMVPVLDPVRHVATQIQHPWRDPETPSSASLPKGQSAYWGNEPAWDGHTSIHNPMMDREGRVWFTSRIRPAAAQPAYCSDGSHPSSKVAPLKESPRHLSMYDPKTNKWTLISTCFATHHLYFASKDPNYTLWTSAGGPGGGVVGWLNTKKYFETGDEAASQGWTPIVVDTNGNGARDDGDTRLRAAFYGVTPSTVDDSVWGQSMGIGFARMNQPGYLMRIVPGPNPAETALTEVYVPPEGAYSPRGIDMGTDGVVWTPLASGHIASFDRRKCKGPLNGPEAASGKLCPEGWTLYRMPGPQFKGID